MTAKLSSRHEILISFKGSWHACASKINVKFRNVLLRI